MFGLSIALKEIFLLYSTQFVFSTVRFVSGNVVMVTIDMCWKSLIRGEWIYGITWKHVYFNIFVLFIVDATSILKLVFPTVYVYVLMIILVAVLLPLLLLLLFLFLFIYLFIYLLIYLFCFFVYLFIYLPFILLLRLLFLILLSLLSPLLLLLLLE